MGAWAGGSILEVGDTTIELDGISAEGTPAPVEHAAEFYDRVAESDALAVVRRRERIFRRALVVADMAAAAFAVFAAMDLAGGDSLRPGYLLVMPLIVVVAKVQGLYDRDELVIRKSTLDELPRLVNLATLFTLLAWLARHFVVIGAPDTKTLLVLWIALIVCIALGRVAARRLAAVFAPRERLFLIGDETTADRMRAKLTHSSTAELVDAVSPDQVELREDALAKLVRGADVHRIVIASGSGLDDERMVDLVRAAKATGLRVTFFPGVLASLGSSVVIDDLWGMPLLGIPRFGLSRSSSAVKRAFDLVGAGIGLILLSPLFLAVAVIIKLDSRGPVFFRQTRVGRAGDAFAILKFRTMVEGADAMKASLRQGPASKHLFKLEDDPRVTRIGRWLRRMSIDELPQLLNVLRGQMSLVGPRPLIVDEDELITGFDRRRLMITPGMTGQWQILGSARVPLHEMLKLDYLYVANWSLWNDVKILVRTVPVVFARRGL